MGEDEVLNDIYADAKLLSYLDAIIGATQAPEAAGIQRLAGVLATGALDGDRDRILHSAKHRAIQDKRTYVLPKDIQAAARDTLSLTLELTDCPVARELGVEGVVQAILDWIEIP